MRALDPNSINTIARSIQVTEGAIAAALVSTAPADRIITRILSKESIIAAFALALDSTTTKIKATTEFSLVVAQASTLQARVTLQAIARSKLAHLRQLVNIMSKTLTS
jgi:hypothetical protein